MYKYSIYDAFTCQGPQTCIIECTRKEGKSYDFQALEDLNELIRNFSPDNLVITGDCFDTQSLRKILYAGVRKKVVLDSFVRSNANAVRQICDKSKLVICHNMLIDKLNTFCPWYATYKTQDILSTNGLDQKYFCNILTSLNNNRDQLGPLLGFNDQWCSYIFNYDIDSIESVCFEQLKNDSFSISQRTIDILAKLPKIQAVVIKSNTLTEHDLQIPYGWIYLKAGQF